MQHTAVAKSTDYFRLDTAGKLDPKKRSALGQFLTPLDIARFMVVAF